ncbi:MAG: helix-hairpin-helix domain-containing protein [Nitrospiraceae bacterium]
MREGLRSLLEKVAAVFVVALAVAALLSQRVPPSESGDTSRRTVIAGPNPVVSTVALRDRAPAIQAGLSEGAGVAPSAGATAVSAKFQPVKTREIVAKRNPREPRMSGAAPHIDERRVVKVQAGEPKLDVNRATQEDFERLPGIGPSIAKQLLDYRVQHGAYREVADLQAVKGIGKKRFERLAPFVTVGAASIDRGPASEGSPKQTRGKEGQGTT